MGSSQMSRAMSFIFQKAGIDGPMSHMPFRKGAVSEGHQNHKDIRGNYWQIPRLIENLPLKSTTEYLTKADLPSR